MTTHWPGSYFGMLVAALMMRSAAQLIKADLGNPLSIIYHPVWTFTEGGRLFLSSTILAWWGFLIYGFFITRWYVPIVFMVLASCLLIVLVGSGIAPQNAFRRLLFGYVLLAVTLVIHF